MKQKFRNSKDAPQCFLVLPLFEVVVVVVVVVVVAVVDVLVGGSPVAIVRLKIESLYMETGKNSSFRKLK